MKVRLPHKDTTGIDNTRTDYIELRDMIAIEAMHSLINFESNESLQKQRRVVISKRAYKMADEMLKARKIKR